MKSSILVLTSLGCVMAGAPNDLWLQRVAPVMSEQERSIYAGLADEQQREAFRIAFWSDKTVSSGEYFDRLVYIDARFGSSPPGSGANTDQGRLYLALGPPTSISQLPSSRTFYPIEIWRYAHVPGFAISNQLEFLFFRPRGAGQWKLYSPQIHTLRALLITNSGTRGIAPVNDATTEGDILNRLKLSPAEGEVLEAAMGVARGIKNSGNSELLYLASSPSAMLRRNTREKVQSKIYAQMARPELTSVQYRTADRIPAVDIMIRASVRSLVQVEVRDLDSAETRFDFEQPKTIAYTQRLFLLPGSYSLLVSTDGHRNSFPLTVAPLKDSDALAPTEPVADLASGVLPVVYRANVGPEAAWVALGRQYLRLADISKAEICFRKALATGRRTPDALAGAGKLLAVRGRLDESRDLLAEALSLTPDHFETLVTLAGVTAEFQDYPKALEYYRHALKIRSLPSLDRAVEELMARVHRQ